MCYQIVTKLLPNCYQIVTKLLCHYQHGSTPVMPLPAWAHPVYASTSVSLPRVCQYNRGLIPVMPLPRSSHPGNRTSKNPNSSCKGPAAGTRTQILCLGGSHPHNQTAALSIRPRRALFCMTASVLVWCRHRLVGSALESPGRPGYATSSVDPLRLCHYQRGPTPVMLLPALAHPGYSTTKVKPPW